MSRVSIASWPNIAQPTGNPRVSEINGGREEREWESEIVFSQMGFHSVCSNQTVLSGGLLQLCTVGESIMPEQHSCAGYRPVSQHGKSSLVVFGFKLSCHKTDLKHINCLLLSYTSGIEIESSAK